MPSARIDDYLGRWSLFGRAIDIIRRDNDVIVATFGIPETFAPRLVLDEDRGVAVIRGGDLDGTALRVSDGGETAVLTIGDVLTLPRWNAGSRLPPVRTHPAPPLDVSPAIEASFHALLEEARHAGGATVVPPAGIGVGDWVHWLTLQEIVLFHGSQNGELEELSPRRTSYEISNQAGRGNLAAVYATHAGLWSMWFSIIDRPRVRGSIRSGAEEHVRADGLRMTAYFFSLDHRQVTDPPFVDGWLYLLPRDTFERLPLFPGGPPSAEWCSREAVRPLARIPVQVQDFPFLDRVDAHDDAELLRYHELADVVREHAQSATVMPDGVVLKLSWRPALAVVMDEYLTLGRAMMPDISCRVEPDGHDTAHLYLQAPPDLTVMLHRTYRDLTTG